MDKKIKLSLLVFISVSTISACTPTNTNSDVVNSTAGVTHTHNGIAHTHRLPVEGLRHSHNINPSNANRTCQPCNANTNVTNNGGNCHLHEGRRHCHPLPASGAQHVHNTGAQDNNPVITPVNNPVIQYNPPSSITIPYPTIPAPQPFPYIPDPYPIHPVPTPPPWTPYPNNTDNSPQNWNNTSCDTASGNYYRVKPKDGVYRIGVNNGGIKRNELIRLNNLQAPDYTIHAGQCLRLR